MLAARWVLGDQQVIEGQCVKVTRRRLGLRRILPFTIALLAMVTLAAWVLASRPQPARSAAMERIFQAQSKLPPEAVRALQDLRLVAAVQAAYFTARSRYGSVDELKQAGYLDPAWPRADTYRVTCAGPPEPSGFVCFADPAPPQLVYFRVDATQAVRYASGHRPDGGSPVFGIPQEGL